MSADKLSLELHGPAVTADAAREAGEALVDLLTALAESEGITPGSIEWDVSVAFQCDGCGLRRPDRPGPDDGWTFSDGDDFCPTCSAAAVSGVAGNPDKDGDQR